MILGNWLPEDARPCFHHVACGLLQCCASRITSVRNWHASTCAECCSSFHLWHTQVRSRPIPSTGMTNYAGSTFLSECRTSWQWLFTGAFRIKHQSTWSAAPSQFLMLSIDSIWDLPVDTSLLFRGFDEARSAVGPSLLGIRWLGTHYRIISVIHRSAAVALGAA